MILYSNYEKAYLNKVVGKKCQHLTELKRCEFLKLLQKNEELFDGTLGTWKKYPVDFELIEDTKPTFSRPYPVPKVHEEMLKK